SSGLYQGAPTTHDCKGGLSMSGPRRTKSLVLAYRSAILDLLTEAGPQTPAEIDQFIRARFRGMWNTRDRKINRNGIPQWQNDVHHARRLLTMAGQIIKGDGRIWAVTKVMKPRIKRKKPISVTAKTKPENKKLFDSLTADV